MTVALSSIRDLLLPGVMDLPGKYDMIPAQWKGYFSQGKSDMAVERSVSLRFLGLANLKNEGAPTNFDNNAGERHIYSQEHIEIGLGYAITRKAVDDNLYKTQFNPSNLGLMESFMQTKEILAANVINTANVYNTQIGGDGVSLVNTAHPVDGYTISNAPTTDVDLNESTLYASLIQIRQFRNNAGLKIFARGRKLLVPIFLEYVAARLTKTELRPGTADNDVNALLHTGGLSEGYEVLDFLTSSFAWFVLTNIKGLIYLERVPFETSMWVDDTTDNLLTKGYERYSFGYNDWRAIWGTFPTA